jgi:tRNA (guanine-N7-)-methyltransferase
MCAVDRPVTRTFKPRRRTLSEARAALMQRLAPQYLLDETGPELDLAAGDVVLEIGIGRGEALVEMAGADPETLLIGCDVHTPGIAAVLGEIERRRLDNVRLVHGDALEFLQRVPASSLVGVCVFFPDPWPKVRQRHRRIVRDDVVSELVRRLQPGGWLHLATDIADYALQMQRVCDAHAELVGGVVDRPPWRPLTRYEERGIAAGHTVTDLWYVRRGVGC